MMVEAEERGLSMKTRRSAVVYLCAVTMIVLVASLAGCHSSSKNVPRQQNDVLTSPKDTLQQQTGILIVSLPSSVAAFAPYKEVPVNLGVYI